MVCSVKGYRLLLTMSEAASLERQQICGRAARKSCSPPATWAQTARLKRCTALPASIPTATS
jgi:cysteine synthase